MILQTIEEKKPLHITLENWQDLWDVANHGNFIEPKKSIVSWVRGHLPEILEKVTIGSLKEFCSMKALPEILPLIDKGYCLLLQRQGHSLWNTPEYLKNYQEAKEHNLTGTLSWLSQNYKSNLMKLFQTDELQDKNQKMDFAKQLELSLGNFAVANDEDKKFIEESVFHFIRWIAPNEKAQENPKFLNILYDCAHSSKNQAFKDILSKFLKDPENQKVCKAAWAVVPKMV
jgi:hypothetical protein